MSETLDRDAALAAARKELTDGAGAAPTLRELLDHLTEAKWLSAHTEAELLDSLSGLSGEPPAATPR